jgi:nucleoside-diphosphate kinase
MSKIERTLSIIKPDAVERNLSNEIVNLLKKNNLKILQNKKIHITKEEAADFYKEHQSKPFYDSLCNYLSSGPIIVMELSGENAIQNYRTLMGATDPKEANKNTIRQLYGVSIDKNSVHGSDSSESANRELNFFFKTSNS